MLHWLLTWPGVWPLLQLLPVLGLLLVRLLVMVVVARLRLAQGWCIELAGYLVASQPDKLLQLLLAPCVHPTAITPCL